MEASGREVPSLSCAPGQTAQTPEHKVKNAAVVWRGTGPAIFPLPGKAIWSFEQFVKPELELRGWVGVKGGKKREEMPRASIATSSIYLCS